MNKVWAAIVILLAIGIVYVSWPVCIKLNPQDLQSFNVPIEQRTDRTLFSFIKVFQKKGDDWYQCKTRLARYFFF